MLTILCSPVAIGDPGLLFGNIKEVAEQREWLGTRR